MERAMETVNTEQDQNFPLVSASWMHSMFGDPGEQAYIQHWKLSNVSDGAEDIKHALFSCNRAREVWGALGIWDVIEKLLSIDRSGSVLIQEIIGRRGLATG